MQFTIFDRKTKDCDTLLQISKQIYIRSLKYTEVDYYFKQPFLKAFCFVISFSEIISLNIKTKKEIFLFIEIYFLVPKQDYFLLTAKDHGSWLEHKITI